MVWGTFFGDKVPQSARLSAGEGGVQKLFGQCPNAPSMNFSGASLSNNIYAQWHSDMIFVKKFTRPVFLGPKFYTKSAYIATMGDGEMKIC